MWCVLDFSWYTRPYKSNKSTKKTKLPFLLSPCTTPHKVYIIPSLSHLRSDSASTSTQPAQNVIVISWQCTSITSQQKRTQILHLIITNRKQVEFWRKRRVIVFLEGCDADDLPIDYYSCSFGLITMQCHHIITSPSLLCLRIPYSCSSLHHILINTFVFSETIYCCIYPGYHFSQVRFWKQEAFFCYEMDVVMQCKIFTTCHFGKPNDIEIWILSLEFERRRIS